MANRIPVFTGSDSYHKSPRRNSTEFVSPWSSTPVPRNTGTSKTNMPATKGELWYDEDENHSSGPRNNRSNNKYHQGDVSPPENRSQTPQPKPSTGGNTKQQYGRQPLPEKFQAQPAKASSNYYTYDVDEVPAKQWHDSDQSQHQAPRKPTNPLIGLGGQPPPQSVTPAEPSRPNNSNQRQPTVPSSSLPQAHIPQRSSTPTPTSSSKREKSSFGLFDWFRKPKEKPVETPTAPPPSQPTPVSHNVQPKPQQSNTVHKPPSLAHQHVPQYPNQPMGNTYQSMMSGPQNAYPTHQPSPAPGPLDMQFVGMPARRSATPTHTRPNAPPMYQQQYTPTPTPVPAPAPSPYQIPPQPLPQQIPPQPVFMWGQQITIIIRN